MDFKVGDVVWLKTGGPAMSVEVVYPGSREVRCAWPAPDAGDPTRLTDIYHFESLTTHEPPTRPSGTPPVPGEQRVYEEGDD